MQALINRSWQQQLRETTAVDHLRHLQFEQFPLAYLQKLTDDFIKASSAGWSLVRVGGMIAPFSPESDKLFGHELSKLKPLGLGIAHVGVLACIHVLSTTSAIAQLSSLIPDHFGGEPTFDELFDEKVSLYLQCLILVHRARPRLYSSQEAHTAKQLLRIAIAGPKPESFPSVSLSKLFGILGPDGEVSELLPDDLIKAILHRARFQVTLGDELERLRADRRWYEAYALVKPIRPLLFQEQSYQRQRAVALIQEFLPHCAIWASWRPSRTRVELWKDRIPATHRYVLRPVFDLEGPDVQDRQHCTLRHSAAYRATGTASFIRLSTDLAVLEWILQLLDVAASVGSESLDLFIYLCLNGGPPAPETLDVLASALEGARQHGDSISKSLKDYHANLLAPPVARLCSLAQIISLLTRIPSLQATFTDCFNLKFAAVDTLSAAQAQFCTSLHTSIPNETLGFSISALGRAMLSAPWLSYHWREWYLTQLTQIPSSAEITVIFHELRTATTQNNLSAREALIHHLGTKLGNSSRRNTRSVLLSDTDIFLLPQDPIWFEPLDPDRHRLREFLRSVPSIPPTLATACLVRSRLEDSTFIRALGSILVGCTDTVCVNLANFLGPRTLHARFHVDAGWKALLLHMMRQRPAGLLGRAAEPMGLVQWQAWEENLRRVFGEQHLDPHGRMGFTVGRIIEITRIKSGG